MRNWQRPFDGDGCGQSELARVAIVTDAKFASLVTHFSHGGMVGRCRQGNFDGNLSDVGQQLGVDEDIAVGGRRDGGHDKARRLKC